MGIFILLCGCASKVDEAALFDTMQRGLEQMDKDDHNAAMEYFRRAIIMAPELWEARYEMGNALARTGRYPEAVLEYRRTIELNPKFSPAYRGMGGVLKAMGWLDAALLNYRLALEHVPVSERGTLQHVMMLKEMGEVLRLLDRCDEALTFYGQALNRMPRYPRALVEAAWCLGKKGATGQSDALYRLALKLSPRIMIGVAGDGELTLLREMAARGGDIHARGGRGDRYTPLMAAVAGGHRAVVSWLLENGADPNVGNDCGTTALLVAVRACDDAMVDLLMGFGADTEDIDCIGTSFGKPESFQQDRRKLTD